MNDFNGVNEIFIATRKVSYTEEQTAPIFSQGRSGGVQKMCPVRSSVPSQQLAQHCTLLVSYTLCVCENFSVQANIEATQNILSFDFVISLPNHFKSGKASNKSVAPQTMLEALHYELKSCHDMNALDARTSAAELLGGCPKGCAAHRYCSLRFFFFSFREAYIFFYRRKFQSHPLAFAICVECFLCSIAVLWKLKVDE